MVTCQSGLLCQRLTGLAISLALRGLRQPGIPRAPTGLLDMARGSGGRLMMTPMLLSFPNNRGTTTLTKPGWDDLGVCKHGRPNIMDPCRRAHCLE
jgi:hypothetical protein